MAVERLTDKKGSYAGSLQTRGDGTTVLRGSNGFYQGSIDRNGTVRDSKGAYQGKGGPTLMKLMGSNK